MTETVKQHLIDAASAAMKNAWAPYSGFRVGAALLAASGRIYSGCNVENSSYPVTTCAERNAIGAAVSAGDTRFEAIVVLSGHPEPVTPCGMCRQALAEFGMDIPVICLGAGGAERTFLVRDLLPAAFDRDFLAEGKNA